MGFSWSVFTNRPICDVICVCGRVWRCHFLPKNDSHGAFASVLFPLYPTLLYYWWADVLHSLNEWEIWEMDSSFKGKSSALCCKFSGNIKNAVILINKRTGTQRTWPLQSIILEVWVKIHKCQVFEYKYDISAVVLVSCSCAQAIWNIKKYSIIKKQLFFLHMVNTLFKTHKT